MDNIFEKNSLTLILLKIFDIYLCHDFAILFYSNSTFIALNLCQKTDSKAYHTRTLFNIQKPETLQGSAPRRKQEIGNLGWVCFSKEV